MVSSESASTPVPYQKMALDEQVMVHNLALELRAKGFSYTKIITNVLDEFGAELQKSTLSYWVRGVHGPLGRAHEFSPAPTPELAHIIGVERGDGSLSTSKLTYSYRIRLQSVDREFVEEFDRSLSKVLNSPRHAFWMGAGRNEIHVQASSFLLQRFLRKPFEELKPFVEHCAECTARFLRGFFDSEECVGTSGSITASNCDISLLEYVQSLLLRVHSIGTTGPFLGSRKGSPVRRRGGVYFRNSDCFVIRIRNRSRLRFLEKIGITILRKKNRLRRILEGGVALRYDSE